MRGFMFLKGVETSAAAEARMLVFGVGTVHPERCWKVDP
jgi:hypothetical protein